MTSPGSPEAGGVTMAVVDLRANDRAPLEHLVGHTGQATELRRALALLRLDDGDDPHEVADRLRVSRPTVSTWAQRFQGRRGAAVDERLADRPRGGRPPTARGILDPLLGAVLDDDP